MDKLYAGTNPVGVITEMLIALLNTNSHVYHISPVLTLMEDCVSEKLGMGEVIILISNYSNYVTC
jgi:glutamate decarboxylase